MYLNFLQNYVIGPSACIEYITSPDLLITFGSYHVCTILWLIISFNKLFQFFLIQFFNKQIIFYVCKFRIFKGTSYLFLNCKFLRYTLENWVICSFSISLILTFLTGLGFAFLTLSRWRLLSNRNKSIDLQSKSMDLFLFDNSLHHERVNIEASGMLLVSSSFSSSSSLMP